MYYNFTGIPTKIVQVCAPAPSNAISGSNIQTKNQWHISAVIMVVILELKQRKDKDKMKNPF
jgi:hypothetical protein